MEKKFTVAQIRNYLHKQDSFGDIFFNLTAENIEKANKQAECNDLPLDVIDDSETFSAW